MIVFNPTAFFVVLISGVLIALVGALFPSLLTAETAGYTAGAVIVLVSLPFELARAGARLMFIPTYAFGAAAIVSQLYRVAGWLGIAAGAVVLVAGVAVAIKWILGIDARRWAKAQRTFERARAAGDRDESIALACESVVEFSPMRAEVCAHDRAVLAFLDARIGGVLSRGQREALQAYDVELAAVSTRSGELNFCSALISERASDVLAELQEDAKHGSLPDLSAAA